MTRQRDWEQIELSFVTTSVSCESLSESTGIPLNTIYRQSSKRNWIAKRKAYQHSHSTSVTEKLRVIDGSPPQSLPPQAPEEGIPEDDEELSERLILYRQQLENEIETTPAKSRESLIQTIIKVEQMRREWFPVSNESYMDSVAAQFVERGISVNEFVSRLRRLANANG